MSDCEWPYRFWLTEAVKLCLQDQTKAATTNDVIRIYVDSPAGVCRAEISQALVQQQLQVCMAAIVWLWCGQLF